MKKTDTTLAETQLRFQKFYQENLQSIYKDLEADRKSGLKFLATSIVLSIVVVLVIGILIHCNIINIYTQISHIICVVAVLGCIALILWPFLRYNSITKSKVMQKLLPFWGDFEYYHEKDIIGLQLVKDAELFSYVNKSIVDDAFRGRYKNVLLTVSEHDLRIHGRRGDTDTRMFKGIMIMLNLQKRFQNKTVILNKGRSINILWNNVLISALLVLVLPILLFLLPMLVIYLIYRHFHPKKATNKVILENLPFMHHWRVFTDNQVEARYILTPVFMEKMLEIKRRFRGFHIDFSFFDDKLLIAVHTRKNMFETTSLFIPALSYRKMREVVGQMYSIFALIDTVLGDNQEITK